jgi:hypothetical protein
MSSLKAPAKFIGSSSGTFKVANLYTRPFLLKQPYLFAKDVKTVFSDRVWCPEARPD